MQATITYLLTEQAQRAQMAATGQPVPRKQTHTIDITVEDLPYLHCDDAGNLSQDLAWVEQYGDKITGVDSAGTPADAWAIYRTQRERLAAAHAKTRAETERQQAAAMDKSFADLIAGTDSRWRLCDNGVTLYNPVNANIEPSHPRYAELRPYVEAAMERKQLADAEITAKREADAAAKREADAAVEAAKHDAIAAYVATSDPLVQQQYDDGLLSRGTVVSMMARSALDAAGLPAECPDSVVCRDSDCPCKDTVVECIPPAVYARWKAFGAPPDDSAVEFHAVRNCYGRCDGRDDDDESAGPLEYHAVVTIPVGPFKFSRRIKV